MNRSMNRPCQNLYQTKAPDLGYNTYYTLQLWGYHMIDRSAETMLELADQFDGYRLDMDDGIAVHWGSFTQKECKIIASALRRPSPQPPKVSREALEGDVLKAWRSSFPSNAYAWPGAPESFASEAVKTVISLRDHQSKTAQSDEESPEWLLACRLAGAELNYRNAYETHGHDHIETGRRWDKMRKAGDAIRAHEPALSQPPASGGEASGPVAYRDCGALRSTLGDIIAAYEWCSVDPVDRGYSTLDSEIHSAKHLLSGRSLSPTIRPAQAEQDDWKSRFLDAIKALHSALDVIEAIDSKSLLTGQIKDLADEALASRQSSSLSSTEGKFPMNGKVLSPEMVKRLQSDMPDPQETFSASFRPCKEAQAECGPDGECLHCGAISGEACLKPKPASPPPPRRASIGGAGGAEMRDRDV